MTTIDLLALVLTTGSAGISVDSLPTDDETAEAYAAALAEGWVTDDCGILHVTDAGRVELS